MLTSLAVVAGTFAGAVVTAPAAAAATDPQPVLPMSQRLFAPVKVDDQLYGGYANQLFTYAVSAPDATGVVSGGRTGVVRAHGTLLAAEPMTTLAVDGGGPGGERVPRMYAWSWNNGGGTRPTGAPGAGYQAIGAYDHGATTGNAHFVPLPTGLSGAPASFDYWSGGEVNQQTGELYLTSGECTAINGSARLGIYDPQTGTARGSARLVPATPADDVFGTADTTCGGQGYVTSDVAVDAAGDAYLLVKGTEGRLHLVRVVPGEHRADWEYTVVGLVRTATGGEHTEALVYGMAFLNGQLYFGYDSVKRMDPVSMRVQSTTADSLFYDLASPQTVPVLTGTVRHDVDGDGRIEDGEGGLAGQTVALYDDAGTLLGTRTTDATGGYSFLLSSTDATFHVRLAQPRVGDAHAVQSYARVTSNGPVNQGTARCVGGDVVDGDGPCAGQVAMPTTDPDVGDIGSVADLSTLPVLTTLVVGTAHEVADVDFGVTAEPVDRPGADVSSSSWTLAPATVTADGSTAATATVRLVDGAGDPLVGEQVTVTAPEGVTVSTVTDHGDGSYSASLTSTSAMVAQVQASVPVDGAPVALPGSPRAVTFVAGAPSAGHSGLSVTPGVVEADGEATHGATVTVQDAHGNPVADVAVTFGADAPVQVSSTTGTTDADGVATAVLTSTRAGEFAVTATLGGSAVTGSGSTVAFRVGAASATASSWEITPGTAVPAGGDFTAVVTVRDQHGNPVAGEAITLDLPAGVTAGGEGPYVSGADGTVTVALTSETAGAHVVTAALGTDPVGDPRLLEFVPAAVSPDHSTITATSPVAADDVDASEVRVVLADEYGNRVTATHDVVVTSSLGTVVTSATRAAGEHTAHVSSPAAGTATIGFTVDDQVSATTSTVLFVAVPDLPSLEPSDGTTVAGTVAPGTTVVVRDADGLPVPGTVAVGEDGRFVFTPDTPLAHEARVVVTAVDEHGFASGPAVVTVDALAPAAPAPPVVLPTTGDVIVVEGVEPGSTPIVRDPETGTELAGAWTDGGDGSWTFTPDVSLVAGDAVEVVVTNPAGDVSAPTHVVVEATASPADPAPEDPSPGDATPGDATPGDPTPDDPTTGDATPDDPSADDETPGDPVPGDPTPEDLATGGPVTGDAGSGGSDSPVPPVVDAPDGSRDAGSATRSGSGPLAVTGAQVSGATALAFALLGGGWLLLLVRRRAGAEVSAPGCGGSRRSARTTRPRR